MNTEIEDTEDETVEPVDGGDGPVDVDPGGGPADEGWAWLISRVTALFLAVLVPLHFWVVVVRDDIGGTTIATVTGRFADARWQALEWLTLVLALVHATLALRGVVRRSLGDGALGNRLVVGMGVVAVLLGFGLTWAMFNLA